MKKKKIISAIISILILMVLFAGCGQQNIQKTTNSTAKESINFNQKPKVTTVNIGSPSQSNKPGGVFGVAIDKGYVDEELSKIGVKFKLVPFPGGGPAINEAFAGTSLDMAIYGDTPAIVAKSSGIDTTLVGVGTTANGASLVVPAKSNIKSVKDLKGKKVATQKGTYMHRTLLEMLKANGLKISDVQFFNMASTDAENAIVSGSIDAIVDGDSSALKLEANKTGKILLNCNKNPEWKGANLVISKTSFAKENPKVVLAILKSLIRAKKYTDANPEDTKKIWATSGVTKEIYDKMYPTNDFKLNVELTKASLGFVERSKKFLKDNKLITKDFDINKWIDKRYYEAANKQ